VRSLAVLQALLVLFVLVPAGVLGWLGLKAADGYEAELRAAYARDLDAAAQQVRERARAAVARIEVIERERLEGAARLLAERLPFDAPSVVLSRVVDLLTAPLPPDLEPLWAHNGLRLAVLDRQGRAILPLASTEPGTAGTTHADLLIADLAREADRQLYAVRDPAAADAVWSEALARASHDRLRARLEVHALWTRVQGGLSGPALDAELDRLVAAYAPENRLGAVRPWALAALRAGREDLLRDVVATTEYLEAPFTDEEREALFQHASRAGSGSAAQRLDSFAPLPGGSTLRVRRLLDPAQAILQAVLPTWMATTRNVRVALPSAHGSPAPADDVLVLRVVVPSLRGTTTTLELSRDLARLNQSVGRRRTWTSVAVGSLLAVVLLGLFLTRRAVLREQEAVRLRDDFLANVSHELRTPLTSVSLHADLLARPDVTPPKRAEHVEVVRAEGARLAALVEDLLDFAALERGARRLAPEPVPVLPAVERAIAPYRVLAEQAGSVLALDLAPPAPRDLEALADPQAVARILANLVGNAFKHGRPTREGVRPTVRVRVAAQAGRVVVEVRDNGPGVPREERAQLFERFRRGRAAGARPGTGLGLALSRALARAMGGDLVWAQEGDETVFRLTLEAFDATMGTAGEARA
jgi:signal transduction histidine kinase